MTKLPNFLLSTCSTKPILLFLESLKLLNYSVTNLSVFFYLNIKWPNYPIIFFLHAQQTKHFNYWMTKLPNYLLSPYSTKQVFHQITTWPNYHMTKLPHDQISCLFNFIIKWPYYPNTFLPHSQQKTILLFLESLQLLNDQIT